LNVSGRTEAAKKSRLGQFLTPVSTASFMAGLFPEATGECRLLDAGAGIGSLSSAFLERCVGGNLNFESIRLKAFEIDDSIHGELRQSLAPYLMSPRISF
jgi:adenine-specific DNA-methyltransferase